jgi:hypothetical protein
MSIIINFSLYQSKFKKIRKKRDISGCEVIIFPGIRYSRANSPVYDDKIVSKKRKALSPKRPGAVNKHGA